MPEIEALTDIDPDDFWGCCSTRERKDMIDIVVYECSEDKDLQDAFVKSIAENFPPNFGSSLNESVIKGRSFDYSEFITSLDKLSKVYYQLSNEDIEKINNLAKRF